MDDDDLREWVHERLQYHWTATKGTPPSSGSFMPDEKTTEVLQRFFSKHSEAENDEFLRTSIEAFIHRTRSTSTPFFVNSALLAPSSLEYLREFRKNGGAYSALPKHTIILSNLLRSEADFLDTAFTTSISHGLDCVDFSTGAFKPDVWWMLAAELSERIPKKKFPPHWLSGTYAIKDGNRILVSDEYATIRKSAKDSNGVVELIMTAQREAVRTSTIGWLEGHKLCGAVSEGGVLVITSCEVDQSLLGVSTPMKSRDNALLSALAGKITMRKVVAADAPKVAASIDPRFTNLTPELQELVEATADS